MLGDLDAWSSGCLAHLCFMVNMDGLGNTPQVQKDVLCSKSAARITATFLPASTICALAISGL